MSALIDVEESLPAGVDAVERIARLTREEVDALPYGLMLFDHAGRVHLYNRYESQLSRRSPEDVLGRSWFRDVAPCTRVAAFEGRFRAFVARGDRAEVLRFDFRFHFLHGAQDVEITFAHAPEPDRVMVIVSRRVLGDGGRHLDITEPVAARADDGRARGGLGSALAAPRAFWVALFDTIDDGTGAALDRSGATWGRAILDGLEAYSERVHQRSLTELPTVLASAMIDEAFAAQGLGRVEVDFGGGEHGILGFAVRAADLPLDVAERLYVAILGELSAGLTGRKLAVIAFGRHGEIVRFAATTHEKAKTLQEWRARGMSANELARRAGLEVWS